MDDSEILSGSDGTTVSLHAGFPNPAADRSAGAPLSLDKLLIAHPISTYIFRIRGHHWEKRGIFDGDIALIDRSVTAGKQDVVIWWQEDGEFCLSSYEHAECQSIWGVVTAIIHQYRKQ